MVWKDFGRFNQIGNSFLEYLELNNLKRTTAKPELKTVFLTFRQTQNLKASYSEILFHLSRRMKKIRVTNGHIYFKGSKDYKSSQNSRSSTNSSKQTPRDDLMSKLRNCKARDTLLSNGQSVVTVKCLDEDIEKNFGYYTYDMGLITQTGSFQMVVTNVSNLELKLKRCLFLRESAYLKLSDKHGCTILDNPNCILMPPGSEYTISVECKAPLGVGSYCADVFLCFDTDLYTGTLLVMRYLRCLRSDDITRLIKPTAPYKRVKKEIPHFVNFITVAGEKENINAKTNRLNRERDLQQYNFDNRLSKASKALALNEDAEMTPAKDQYEASLQKIVAEDLQLDNYGVRFSLLLHLEEHQCTRDIHAYDLKNVTLTRQGRKFSLEVPGLAEKRPSVLRGDKIFFMRINDQGKIFELKRFEGYVHKVELNNLLLGLGQEFRRIFLDGMKFNVSFTFNRLPLKLMHRAVLSVGKSEYEEVLFPDEVIPTPVASYQLNLFDKKLETNLEQVQAVKSIVFGQTKSPYVIYGPPGTGKTVTMVETIKQLVKRDRNVHVIICAPSNSACDLMVQRLMGNIDKRLILRMYAMSRPYQEIPEDIRPVTNYSDGEFFYPSKAELTKYQVIATTLITAGRISSACFPRDHFDYVFVDEAGHAVEPEFIIAVENVLSSNGRVILAGDHHQLGPIIRSQVAVDHGFGKSFMERLMEDQEIYHKNSDEEFDSNVITKLLNNYRSHPAIIGLPNELFYSGELKVRADKMMRESLCKWDGLPRRDFPMVFHGVVGEDLREGNSPSFFNPQEVSKVYQYVESILAYRTNRTEPKDIGIISPYRKQVCKIREVLKEKMRERSKMIKVGSVEEFQGQERKVIIISTVRSDSQHLRMDTKFNLGFLRNPKRFNVAITRAKALLVVVGNPRILCKDHYWKRFLDYCRDNGGFTGVSPGDDEDEDGLDDDSDGETSDLTRRLESIGLDDQVLSRLQELVMPQWRNEE